MKKTLLVILGLLFAVSYHLESQGLLNKVKNAVTKEIIGTNQDENNSNSSKPGPEPACACDDAKMVVDLTKFKIHYKEFTICSKDDGSMLVYDKIGSKYYISKTGVTEGPYQ